MITISKLTSGDSIVIDEKPNSILYDATARVSKTKTLDGGVVVDHRGFAVGDRTVEIKCELSATDEATLRTLFENETIVYISTKDGFYSGAIERLRGGYGNIEFAISLKAAA